ncbi:ABC transporter permease [Clostridium sp. LP20]|uniref:ABC transporter permease n=1 Tax=Clostridium sp. LP20 TaxID=3418665 RepID=UPI003EE67FCC
MLNALKSLKRMKFLAFLIVLQFSIGLMMLNSSAVTIETSRNKMNYFNNLFDFNKTHLLRVFPNDSIFQNDNIDFFAEATPIIKDFHNKLQEMKSNDIINRSSIYFIYPNAISELYEYCPKEYLQLPQDLPARYTTSIMINYDFFNRYDLKLSEGRNFTKADFEIDYKKENIPLILGKDYKEHYKIGDTISQNISDTEKITFKIIGFYEDNAIPSILSKTEFIENITFSNALSIFPTVKNLDFFNETVAINDVGCFVEANNDMSIDYVKEQFKKDYGNSNFIIRDIPLKDDYIPAKEVLYKDVINSVVLGLILTILSVIGVISVLLGEIKERRKEFGIRIACGATINDLCKELFFEVLYIMGACSLLSIVSLWLKQSLFITAKIINLNIVLYNVGLVLILTLFIGIIPIIKLRKIIVADLMRGE